MSVSRMVRARTYCARRNRYGAWFPCLEDRACDLIDQAWQRHQDKCPKRSTS
jgi:hypothetical protein